MLGFAHRKAFLVDMASEENAPAKRRRNASSSTTCHHTKSSVSFLESSSFVFVL